MAIPSEQASSERLLRYARYHLAALKADPRAEHLAAAVQEDTTALTMRYRGRFEAEDGEAEASARLNRAELDIDEACRAVELEVLAACNKDRDKDDYRATFPQGLSAFIAARGEAQARKVEGLVVVLRARLPELAERRGAELEQLATKLSEAEKAMKTAREGVSNATLEERLARSAIVRQLYRNRGALAAIYPQDRRRVASFFPPARERPVEVEADDATGEGDPEGGSDPTGT